MIISLKEFKNILPNGTVLYDLINDNFEVKINNEYIMSIGNFYLTDMDYYLV